MQFLFPYPRMLGKQQSCHDMWWGDSSRWPVFIKSNFLLISAPSYKETFAHWCDTPGLTLELRDNFLEISQAVPMAFSMDLPKLPAWNKNQLVYRHGAVTTSNKRDAFEFLNSETGNHYSTSFHTCCKISPIWLTAKLCPRIGSGSQHLKKLEPAKPKKRTSVSQPAYLVYWFGNWFAIPCWCRAAGSGKAEPVYCISSTSYGVASHNDTRQRAFFSFAFSTAGFIFSDTAVYYTWWNQ